MQKLSAVTPIQAVLLSIVALLVFASGAHRLSINADTRVFFSQNNDNRKALDLFEKRYASSVNLLIALHAEEGSIFTDERLAALERLTEKAWQIPYATRVESIINATHISSDTDGIIIADTAALESAGDAASAGERTMADNLLVGRLISADAKTAAINVIVQYPAESSAAARDILYAAKELVASANLEAMGLKAWYGGRVASSNAFSQASKDDLKTLLPLSFLTFLVILVILKGSFVIGGSLLISASFAAASALGLAGWIGIKINAATAHTPTIIVALCVASLSHLAISTRRYLEAGMSQDMAVKSALELDRRPIILTLCTTSVGFLTLLAADAPPFQQLGLLASVGALFSLFYGLVLFPALLQLFKIKRVKPNGRLNELVRLASQIAINKRRSLLIGLPIVCVLSIGGFQHIVIDDSFPDYFDERFEFRRHADLIETHLTGLEVVEFDIGSPEENGIFASQYVDKVSQFEDWLHDQAKVVHVSSVLEIYRRLNQHLNDGDPVNYLIPDDREALAQYMLLYEMSLPLGLELTNAVTIDKSRSRVTAIMHDASSSEVRQLRERAEDWLNETKAQDINGPGTGLAVMYAYLSSLNVKSMAGGTVLALGIISAILIFGFRSISYAAISLLPNLFPGLIAFGVWGYFVGEIGVAVSVVGAMTLGIIVDDTIHLIYRYREARNNGASPEIAVRNMFEKVGEPMLISTIALVFGFSLLTISGFHITSSTGALVAGTIASALVLDWFLLAPFLIAFDNWRLARLKNQTVGALALK